MSEKLGRDANMILPRMLSATLALLTAIAAVPVAQATGMGRMNVLSTLGQPLNVEIELISVTPAERGALSARLASLRAYELLNLPIGAAGDSGIRVSVDQRGTGEPFIRVTSSKPIYEPFVHLLIELTSVSGPITRQFAVLLDPPEIAPTRAESPLLKPAITSAPAPTIQIPSTQLLENDYGPVQSGETLSRIAAKVRPKNASLQQTMLGIFRHNPEAFINNNINLLKAGRRLRIPSPDHIASISPTDSAQTLRAHTATWASNRTVAEAGSGNAQKTVEKPAPKPATQTKASDAGKPIVKLSSGTLSAKNAPIEERVRMLEEDLAARERALNDANERIKRLEKATAGASGAEKRSK